MKKLSFNVKFALMHSIYEVLDYLNDEVIKISKEYRFTGRYTDIPVWHYKRDLNGDYILDEDNNKIKVYEYDDEGNMKYEPEYDYVDLSPDELSEDTKMKLVAIDILKDYLENIL